MKKYGVNELRQMFLDFMESKGHLVMKSFSLVPQGDKSLLLINAGMAPLKPYFTGAEKPPRTRVTTCQKCIRTGDIENVGKTAPVKYGFSGAIPALISRRLFSPCGTREKLFITRCPLLSIKSRNILRSSFTPYFFMLLSSLCQPLFAAFPDFEICIRKCCIYGKLFYTDFFEFLFASLENDSFSCKSRAGIKPFRGSSCDPAGWCIY